jgi:ABC-type multidrug transport system fused ATPase/permease subunit
MNLLEQLYKPTNVVEEILFKFISQNQWTFILIICIIITTNLLQTNVISTLVSSIIDAVEHKQHDNAFTQFTYFVAVSLVFFMLYFSSEFLQTTLINKIPPFTRIDILKHFFDSNIENMTQQNVSGFVIPINRTTYAYMLLVNMIMNVIVTNLSFILIITIYFLYKNTNLGILFIVINAILIGYCYYALNILTKGKLELEVKYSRLDSNLTDMFNNFDKIIYRAETQTALNKFSTISEDILNKTYKVYSQVTKYQLFILIIVYTFIFAGIFYLLYLVRHSIIDTKLFITFITITLLYRDKLINLGYSIPTIIDLHARLQNSSNNLRDISLKSKGPIATSKSYQEFKLDFNEIRFEKVSYKYESTKKTIIQNFDLTLNTNNQVIGISGESGKGKSTLMKLVLRLNNTYEGNIYIDGVNIQEVNPEYIRKKITYVNQNSKLFDETVIDNLMYGCSNKSECNQKLEMILKDPLIQNLFKNVDIQTKKAGSLGEHLSGGQRQIVNILGGLINPSPILILDEPTNALDLELKKEIIQIIDTFKEYKKCIIIISHDRDVYPLFDRHVRL